MYRITCKRYEYACLLFNLLKINKITYAGVVSKI